MASFYTGTNDFLKLLTFAKIFALCFDSALFGTMLSQAERCLGQRSVTAERCPGQCPAKMNTVQCMYSMYTGQNGVKAERCPGQCSAKINTVQDSTESKLSAVANSPQSR